MKVVEIKDDEVLEVGTRVIHKGTLEVGRVVKRAFNGTSEVSYNEHTPPYTQPHRGILRIIREPEDFAYPSIGKWVKRMGDSESFYVIECDYENAQVLIATTPDINDKDYDDYWVTVDQLVW